MAARNPLRTRGGPDARAGAPETPAQELIAVVRDEVGAAARLTLALGVVLAFATFGVTASKLVIWQTVIPTGNAWTLAGLIVLFSMALCIFVALDQLRELGLMAIARRLAQRLAGPLVLVVAQQPGRSDIAAQQALRDVEELRRDLAGPVLTSIVDAVLVPSMVLLLLFFHWAFAAWALGFAVLAALLSLLGDRLMRRTLLASNEAHARTSGLVADAMRCAEAVEAMGLRGVLAARWQDRIADSAEALGRAQAGGRWISAALSAVSGIATGGALIVGTAMISYGINVGFGMVLAMLLTGKIISPFARLGAAMHEWGAALAAWRRLQGLLGPDAPRPEGIAFPCRTARLTLERATWAPRGAARALLRDVSLVVEPGQVVAIAGGAGAGKTTLLRLAVGMIQPIAGGCFLDGHATAQWEREDFARHVGYLPQDPLLTDGTVAEAIARLGEPDMAAVIAAARLADAHGLVTALPHGYATRIRAEGPLSAGQRQRVALARALYGGPRLLVLDEPAAFLDAEGEARLVRLLRLLAAQGTGVLLTSHRPALLAAAHRVMVLRGGQLANAQAGPGGPAALPPPGMRAA
ncbi:ATP-binding cassette domain-containing protein [Falsiroseomonas sp. CW058]|uniref:ATP-binding cassette domain-containing protein n=1 Tax=Falsiroseomonas sp. CW058 TaxID=3388664 RepID=UPI003D31E770